MKSNILLQTSLNKLHSKLVINKTYFIKKGKVINKMNGKLDVIQFYNFIKKNN